MKITLRMTGLQHGNIKKHVMAEDGREAGSLLFCKPVFRENETILLVKKILHIPYDKCSQRTPTALSWPTKNILMPQYEMLERQGLSLIMLHSHPNGYPDFSYTDNQNDLSILSRLTCAIEGPQPHGSAIMLPDGSIKARIIDENDRFIEIDKISVAGDEIRFFGSFLNNAAGEQPSYMAKNAQFYGSKTTNIMRVLRIGVVGCSGTGSPTIELLLRYLVGQLRLFDFDVIEEGNLNRMLMSRMKDADEKKLKVERYAEWVNEAGLKTIVEIFNDIVPSEKTTKALSECDIIFGCVDNVAARHAVNKIASAYLIPYFDLGVSVKAYKDQPDQLQHVTAKCHYLQPDKACLLDRQAFSAERLAEENFRRDDPEFYKKLKELGYTHTGDIQAVMVLTMKAAIMGIDDLMARLNNYRIDANKDFDEQSHSFTHGFYDHKSHNSGNMALKNFIASGDDHVKL